MECLIFSHYDCYLFQTFPKLRSVSHISRSISYLSFQTILLHLYFSLSTVFQFFTYILFVTVYDTDYDDKLTKYFHIHTSQPQYSNIYVINYNKIKTMERYTLYSHNEQYWNRYIIVCFALLVLLVAVLVTTITSLYDLLYSYLLGKMHKTTQHFNNIMLELFISYINVTHIWYPVMLSSAWTGDPVTRVHLCYSAGLIFCTGIGMKTA